MKQYKCRVYIFSDIAVFFLMALNKNKKQHKQIKRTSRFFFIIKQQKKTKKKKVIFELKDLILISLHSIYIENYTIQNQKR